jgi:inner membrane protein
LAAGLLAAIFHRKLEVRPLTAGVVIAAAMASHGLLDMMTDRGMPVAYLWPLSSVRLFADWRPIRSEPVHIAYFFSSGWVRFQSEILQLIIPMFVVAFAVRACRRALTKLQLNANPIE